MKKYVVITNDRGTVVEAVCYKLNDDGDFLAREHKDTIHIPYTPKYMDKLNYNESYVSKEQYEKVLEYVRALEQLEFKSALHHSDILKRW